ncbi:flagellar hook-length control protein FliK [Carboxydothermus pertinax]|uniref:Flagellar hook-length control protein FliK n=1 Tax=Carboxydothermus pertinax TaxID=870242 RepID=A0A1L8CUD9_9THEO|nr:flagellar hook-length control protein FliK [Carboxydothermus pertinax]GAV22565.1 flagellar hook-length control protein FliK [Carboxydothermus pertinax]
MKVNGVALAPDQKSIPDSLMDILTVIDDTFEKVFSEILLKGNAFTADFSLKMSEPENNVIKPQEDQQKTVEQEVESLATELNFVLPWFGSYLIPKTVDGVVGRELAGNDGGKEISQDVVVAAARVIEEKNSRYLDKISISLVAERKEPEKEINLTKNIPKEVMPENGANILQKTPEAAKALASNNPVKGNISGVEPAELTLKVSKIGTSLVAEREEPEKEINLTKNIPKEVMPENGANILQKIPIAAKALASNNPVKGNISGVEPAELTLKVSKIGTSLVAERKEPEKEINVAKNIPKEVTQAAPTETTQSYVFIKEPLDFAKNFNQCQNQNKIDYPAFSEKIVALVQKTVQTKEKTAAVLKLYPEEFGEVKVEVKLLANNVDIALKVTSSDAANYLQNLAKDLATALQKHNLELTGYVVGFEQQSSKGNPGNSQHQRVPLKPSRFQNVIDEPIFEIAGWQERVTGLNYLI